MSNKASNNDLDKAIEAATTGNPFFKLKPTGLLVQRLRNESNSDLKSFSNNRDSDDNSSAGSSVELTRKLGKLVSNDKQRNGSGNYYNEDQFSATISSKPAVDDIEELKFRIPFNVKLKQTEYGARLIEQERKPHPSILIQKQQPQSQQTTQNPPPVQDVTHLSIDTNRSDSAHDLIVDIKSALRSAATQSRKTLLESRGVNTFVVAAKSNTKPRSEQELAYEEGDVLLITDTISDTPGLLVARHETTGETGTIRAEYMREYDNTLFADVLSLADQDISQIISPTSPYSTLSSLSARHPPHIRQLVKSSLFNSTAAVESDTSHLPIDKVPRQPVHLLEHGWSSRVGQGVLTKIDSMERKRQESIYELMETEKTFLRDMQMVQSEYLDKISETNGIVASDKRYEQLVIDLQRIVVTSERACRKYSDIQTKMNGIIADIGSILLSEVQNLREYADFCSNLSSTFQFIQTLKASNPEFAAKLQEYGRHPYFANLDLNSQLLKPMQRVTKIPLMIREIRKYTPESKSDHLELKNVEMVSQEVLLYINSRCGEVEDRLKLEKVQIKLDQDLGKQLGQGFLLPQNRRIIYGSTAVECNGKKVAMYLFEDLLLITQEQQYQNQKLFPLFKPSSTRSGGGSGSNNNNLNVLYLKDITVLTDEQQSKSPGRQDKHLTKKQQKSQKSFSIQQKKISESGKPLIQDIYQITVETIRERGQWTRLILEFQKKSGNEGRN